MELSKIKDIVNIAESIITSIGILLGGFWTYNRFVKNRGKYPSANIEHKIKLLPIVDKKVLLHVTVYIYNIGNVLLKLVSGRTDVNQILPPTQELLNSINDNDIECLFEEGRKELSWSQISPIKCLEIE